jgi:uncharacterized membrane protein
MVPHEDVVPCAICAAVLGGFWGVVIGVFYPVAGVLIGGGLFALTFSVLVHNCSMAEEADEKIRDVASQPKENT